MKRNVLLIFFCAITTAWGQAPGPDLSGFRAATGCSSIEKAAIRIAGENERKTVLIATVPGDEYPTSTIIRALACVIDQLKDLYQMVPGSFSGFGGQPTTEQVSNIQISHPGLMVASASLERKADKPPVKK